MKQWLYDGWFRFKAWVLFNYWRHLTNEDASELRKLYYLKRWEKRAMKAYVERINKQCPTKETADMTGSSWYVGDIANDWQDRIDAKISFERHLKRSEKKKDD